MSSSSFHEVRVATLEELFASPRRWRSRPRSATDDGPDDGRRGQHRRRQPLPRAGTRGTDHARHVAEWAEATLGRRAAPAAVGWRTPEGQELGDLDRDPRLLTPYRALGVAVHNEERAFGFYSYVAANTEDEAVRRQAEAFAREELGHAAWLRQERRRAYHAEGRGRRWRLGGDRPSSPAAFLATAAALERALAERHAACAARLRAAGDPAAAAVAEVARLDGEEAARLERSVPPAAERAAVVPPPADALTPVDCALDLEEAYEAYAAAADALVTEEALREAQALAQSAVARIGRLRGWPARGARDAVNPATARGLQRCHVTTEPGEDHARHPSDPARRRPADRRGRPRAGRGPTTASPPPGSPSRRRAMGPPPPRASRAPPATAS